MVEMFDGGAAGYVFKNRLSELVPVIEQALEDARQRARRLAEETARRIAAATPAAPRSEARTPRNLRPICGRCKQVRNDGGEWEPLESHLKQHRQATITLALCPACALR
jgi:hypothetical protein